MHTHIRARKHIHIYIRTRMHTHTHYHTHIYIHTHTHKHTHTTTHMYACLRVCVLLLCTLCVVYLLIMIIYIINYIHFIFGCNLLNTLLFTFTKQCIDILFSLTNQLLFTNILHFILFLAFNIISSSEISNSLICIFFHFLCIIYYSPPPSQKKNINFTLRVCACACTIWF